MGARPGGARDGAPDDRPLLVIARIGDRHLALGVEVCRGVSALEHLATPAGPPPHVRGFTSLRGRVVAVADPRPALGLEPLGDDLAGQQLLGVTASSGRYALLVDEVDTVRPAEDGDAAPSDVEALVAGRVPSADDGS